jgi:hypothetical protein
VDGGKPLAQHKGEEEEGSRFHKELLRFAGFFWGRQLLTQSHAANKPPTNGQLPQGAIWHPHHDWSAAFTPHQRPNLMALTKHNGFRCILREAA